MKKHFEVYQVSEDKSREFGFMGLSFIVDHYGKVDKANYSKVYDSCIETEDGKQNWEVLETLFYIFNCEHPSDFKGHSLSVSDVVKLEDKFFYCDSFGWKEINF